MTTEGERLHFGIPEAVSALCILLVLLTIGIGLRVLLEWKLRKTRIE